jgi:hypothetical protein
MKVRFYCDVPPYTYNGLALYAGTHPPGPNITEGYTRVCFDVDMPPNVLKPFDVVAPAAAAQEISVEPPQAE